MRTTHRTLTSVVLTALVVIAFTATALSDVTPQRVMSASAFHAPERPNYLLWYDPIDEESEGWTHGDYTADAVTEFHVDAYQTHPDGELSYWCGRLDPAFSGGDGYGNSWDQRLLLPPIDLGTTVVEERSWGMIKADYRDAAVAERRAASSDAKTRGGSTPVLSFSYRHDCEITLDATWLQAEVDGEWVDVLGPFTGSSAGWQESGVVPVDGYGDPLTLRFRFLSDGGWSDEDGLYDSIGGAFHVDNIRVYDFATGEDLFLDDVDSTPPQCVPAIPNPAGDWWHIHEDYCSSAAYGYGLDPMCWWCGDESDSTLIPPGLQNWLQTPFIDRYVGYGHVSMCTLRFSIHPEIPIGHGDYWTEEVTWDSGVTWYLMGTRWEDFAQCHGFAQYAFPPEGLSFYAIGSGLAAARWTLYTDDDGCGPGAAGSAGISLDHTWLEGDYLGSGSESSWETIRAITR